MSVFTFHNQLSHLPSLPLLSSSSSSISRCVNYRPSSIRSTLRLPSIGRFDALLSYCSLVAATSWRHPPFLPFSSLRGFGEEKKNGIKTAYVSSRITEILRGRYGYEAMPQPRSQSIRENGVAREWMRLCGRASSSSSPAEPIDLP